MKDRPILMSAWSISKILDENKTVTRRTSGLKKFNDSQWRDAPGEWRKNGDTWGFFSYDHGVTVIHAKCPYGDAGTVLWVKETWFEMVDPRTSQPYDPPRFCYRATYEKDFPGHGEPFVDDGDGFPVINKNGTMKSPWKSSLYMPRQASRITLENLGSRPEKLHSITVLDVAREGVLKSGPINGDEFQKVWDSINPRYPWESNPTVWRIEFRRIGDG